MATSKQHRFIDPGSLRSPSQAIAPQSVPPPLERIDPPNPPRKERPITNFLSGLLSLIVIVSLIGVGVFFYVERQIVAPGPLLEEKVVNIGGGSTEVIEQLERDGVVDKPFLLALYLHLTGKASKLKKGEYLFRTEISLKDVVAVLVEGKPLLHSVTIPEGRTSKQIVEILMGEDALVGEIPVTPKEGSLLPETYKVERGMSRAQLLDRMAQDFDKLVKEAWERRAPNLPLSSPQELVILASIVEKETGKADERPRIAGVFINRLNRGMKLQSDPTIIYGLVGGVGTLGRPISRADINAVNTYNTYVVPALPSGPICNPGRDALEAVANPSKTRELYFVADGTGAHVFAETYEQHKRNVARWRQIEAGRNDKFDEADDAVPTAADPPKETLAPPAQAPAAVAPAPVVPAPKPVPPAAKPGQAKPGQAKQAPAAPVTKQTPPAKPAVAAPKPPPKAPKKPLLPEEELPADADGEAVADDPALAAE